MRLSSVAALVAALRVAAELERLGAMDPRNPAKETKNAEAR